MGMNDNNLSAQPCGCDPGIFYICAQHQQMASLAPSEGRRMSFAVKDSGQRQQFASGMQRDTGEGKIDYTLIFDGPMLDRWAEHLTKGAQKYEARNWMKADSQKEQERFRVSAVRHFRRWLRGDNDEDHAAAVFFNINGHAYTEEKLRAGRCSTEREG